MITLIHDLIIDVDECKYTLMLDKHKVDKKGKSVYEVLGYYSNLTTAVHGAREYCIKQHLKSGLYGLYDALNEITKITNEFMNLLREKGGEG
jgi:hypothetical protein